jgi:nucleoside-diphosphate-sugar epimerase
MRYFVTGGTGFIGGRVIQQLREAGHEVAALVRTPTMAKHLAEIGAEIYPGDITDKESLRQPMTGADGVFHIAAWYKVGERNKRPAEQINVGGTRNVLEMMQELAIPKGVYTSTIAVFGNTRGQIVDETYFHDPQGKWISEYERTKWLAHYQVARPMADAGLPLVIAMPALVYGPGDTSIVRKTFIQYLQGKLPMIPRDVAYNWGYIDDVARGHLLAMEKGRTGEDYIITGEVATFAKALDIAEEITGIPAPRLRPPKELMGMLAPLMDAVGALVPLPEMYAGETLRSMAGTFTVSAEKARRELGFQARPIKEGLGETLLHEMRLLGMPTPEDS